jgi:hypothetical protein
MHRLIAARGEFLSNRATKWLSGAGAVFALVVVGLLDYVTGRDFSFTLLYLAPIAIAVWFVGPAFALVLCFLAPFCGLIVEISDRAPLSATIWNAGIRFGVYVVVYVLLSHLRQHKAAGTAMPHARRWLVLGAVIPCVMLIAAGIVHHWWPGGNSLRAANGSSSNERLTKQGPLAELASVVQQSMRSSRPLLLGSRDPNGPSCIDISRSGDVKGVMPENRGDLDGGPGTSMAVLYFFDRRQIKSPVEDFKWHQMRLRTYLENNITLGGDAEDLAHESAEKAIEFLEAANSWSALPSNIVPIGFTRRDDWPSYCLASLDTAVRDNDLVDVQKWSRELAAATFWLEDLLRWRAFLYKNYLTALDFQAQCESLFVAAENQKLEYKPDSTMSQFPAGVLGLNGKGNFYEIERQAERLFSMPADRLVEIASNKHLTSNSVWMPPASREGFLQLRSVLSPDNQKTWDLAARTPYQHGYLVNLLFRARTAELVDELAAVLKKADARNRHATVNELMGVMMYRGHSFGGIEWGDRFQPQLTEAAERIKLSESDLEALHDAWQWTNHFYQSPAEYGITLTLRDALEQKRLDCVRSTDMISAIFRNAGRTHLGHVRWCCETGGHSVAAYMGMLDSGGKGLLADGLTPPHDPEVWPDCYFHGHAWPPGLERPEQPYAMELYVRGIDSYIWCQGYIVRGPNAGSLTTAAIPYSSHFLNASTQKVYGGPYPK